MFYIVNTLCNSAVLLQFSFDKIELNWIIVGFASEHCFLLVNFTAITLVCAVGWL